MWATATSGFVWHGATASERTSRTMQLQELETTWLFVAAERAARRFSRKQADPWLDPEDVRQDLLLDFLARIKGYDPERGSLAVFASICFVHRASRLGDRSRHDRQHRQTISFETPLSDASTVTLGDILSDDDHGQGSAANSGALARAEGLLDLDRALSSLPADLVSLCALLVVNERDPVGASGLPRTTFYRRVTELRCHLLAAGITVPRGSRAVVQ